MDRATVLENQIGTGLLEGVEQDVNSALDIYSENISRISDIEDFNLELNRIHENSEDNIKASYLIDSEEFDNPKQVELWIYNWRDGSEIFGRTVKILQGNLSEMRYRNIINCLSEISEADCFYYEGELGDLRVDFEYDIQ